MYNTHVQYNPYYMYVHVHVHVYNKYMMTTG